ncbi:MAG: hypothetical protein HZB38_18855 [Planctomycetes bacterium]|nr:hypothetical protein [Planctomycetota bacterium]
MKYLGTARCDNGHVVMPDGFAAPTPGQTYEVVEIDGDLLLTLSPLDRARQARIDELTQQTIRDHRKTLEGLAK